MPRKVSDPEFIVSDNGYCIFSLKVISQGSLGVNQITWFYVKLAWSCIYITFGEVLDFKRVIHPGRLSLMLFGHFGVTSYGLARSSLVFPDVQWLWNQDASRDLLLAIHPPNYIVLWNADTGTKLWKKSYADNILSFSFDPFDPSHLTCKYNFVWKMSYRRC